MKKRKFYEKPSMLVFELKQHPQILAGSGKFDPYQPGDFSW